MTKIFLPPWDLEGQGYFLLFRFDREFINHEGRFPEGVVADGGFGCVAVVNVLSSNVGPYGELLFIPGKGRGKRGRII